MAEPRRTITYEVYIRRGSRWEIHARFDAAGRNMALTRARAANRHPGILAVKVVKEIYDPVDGTAQEFIFYRSRAPRRTVPAADAGSPRRPLLRRGLERILAAPRALGSIVADLFRVVVTSPHWAILPRALASTFAAFFAAVLVTVIVAYGLDRGLPVPSSWDGGGLGVLLVVFSGIFLIGALAMAVLVAVGLGCTFTSFAGLRDAPPARARPRPAAPSRGRLRPPAAPSPPPPSPGAETPPLPPPVEVLRGQIVGYLRKAIQPARGAYDLGDSHIRFGINLFVAGACEGLCQKQEIDTPTTAAIMAAGLRAVGVDSDHAASLAGNYVESLISDIRCMAMFGHGRRAILDHLAGRPDAADMLWRALGDWTLPQARNQPCSLVSVMFTRVTGLEGAFGSRDDERALRIAHAHNRVVDCRLIEFQGKRIKNTPSGAMAAFMSALDAMRAANAIRADFAEHAHLTPEPALSIAIGLNCGQPIAEGNDLFGTSVQLAARIVEIAKPGQILASLAFRDRILADTPRAAFSPRGPVSLRGFDAPIPLYEPIAS